MSKRIALLFSEWQVAGQNSGALYRWVNSFEQGWVSLNERQSKEVQELWKVIYSKRCKLIDDCEFEPNRFW